MTLTHDMIARVKKFDKENGRFVVKYQPGWFLFSTGAIREKNPAGALIDPPSDAYKRFKLVALYQEIRLQHAVNEFEQLKQQLLARGRFGDKAEAEAKLKHAQQIVKERQAALKVAKRKVKEAKPAGLRMAERGAAEDDAETEAYLDAVSKFKV